MRRLSHILCAATLLALTAPQAPAETAGDPHVVGITVLGGKRVELLSDQTWRFQEAPVAAGPCVPVNTTIDFCGTILNWRPTSTEGSEFLRLFRHDDRNYAGIIYEELGTGDGISLEFMRRAVIENVASVVGVPANEIPVLDVVDVDVDGINGERITYGAEVNGLGFVYHNTIIVTRAITIQFVTWHVTKEATDANRALHQRFTESIRLSVPESDI